MFRFFKKIKFKDNTIWYCFFLCISLILISAFLLEFKIVGQAVYGDARYYMGITRSLYFSHNVDLSDEVDHYWSPESNNLPAKFESVPEFKKTIKVISSNFSLGISIIWLPIYFIADLLVVFFSKFNPGIIRNGYNDIYQITLGFGNIFFVLSGLAILSKLLLKFYSKRIVMLSIVLITFATNLLYYGGIDVVNSHPFSFLGTSVLLYLFFKYKNKKNTKVLLFQGFVFGLLIANRMQDLALFLIPLVTVLSGTKSFKFKNKNIRNLFILIMGTITGYLPQLFLLFLGQGKFTLIPHLSKAEHDFFPFVHVLDILFNQKLGTLYYMPILFFAFFGLFLFRKRNKLYGTVFLSTFLVVFFLISSYDGWNVAGYTLRYFISIFPLLAFGLAEVIILLEKRFSHLFIYLVIFFFIAHQGLSILSFKLFWQDPTYVGAGLSRSGIIKTQVIETIYKYLSTF